MAKKEKYEVHHVIRALKAAQGNIAGAAKQLKCSEQTVRNYIARYPDIQLVLDQEREPIIDLAEYQLLEKLKEGEWAAIKYTLSTIGKHRGWVERTEVASVNVEDLSDEELNAILDD